MIIVKADHIGRLLFFCAYGFEKRKQAPMYGLTGCAPKNDGGRYAFTKKEKGCDICEKALKIVFFWG